MPYTAANAVRFRKVNITRRSREDAFPAKPGALRGAAWCRAAKGMQINWSDPS